MLSVPLRRWSSSPINLCSFVSVLARVLVSEEDCDAWEADVAPLISEREVQNNVLPTFLPHGGKENDDASWYNVLSSRRAATALTWPLQSKRPAFIIPCEISGLPSLWLDICPVWPRSSCALHCGFVVRILALEPVGIIYQRTSFKFSSPFLPHFRYLRHLWTIPGRHFSHCSINITSISARARWMLAVYFYCTGVRKFETTLQ